jgi:hypothetical protein
MCISTPHMTPCSQCPWFPPSVGATGNYRGIWAQSSNIQTPPLPSSSGAYSSVFPSRAFHPPGAGSSIHWETDCASLEAVWPAGGDETRCSDVVIWATKHGGFWMSIIRHVISCLISPKNAGVGFPGDLDINWYFKLGVWR